MTTEQAKELGQLELWGAYKDEIDRLINFEEKKLRLCKPEELVAFQMKIAAYEAAKAIPQNVIDRESE